MPSICPAAAALLTVLCGTAAFATAADDLTGTVETLANPTRQWYGPSFALAGSGGATAFDGNIYIGWGSTNNRWWKPVLAYRVADDQVINDLPLNRLAHSCLAGGDGSAFRVYDNELFLQDYDNQAGGQQASRMRGGWRISQVGTGAGSDGATKGHDADVVRHGGLLFRERGLYLAGGANLSLSTDGATWRIAGRGANYPRNAAAQNWLFPERLLPLDGGLAMLGSAFSAAQFPAEAPVAVLATWSGDPDEPARPALFAEHQLLGGRRVAIWMPFQGRAVGCNADGGMRVDRFVGADTGLQTFAWPDPDQGADVLQRHLPCLGIVDGRIVALSQYAIDPGHDGTADAIRLVLRSSTDGLAWGEEWRCDLPGLETVHGIAWADGAWYTGYGDPRSSGGGMRSGNLLRLRPLRTNRPPTVSLGSVSTSDAVAPGAASISATASDPDGSIDRVEFYAGTTLIGSDTSAPYSVNWSNIPAGTWTISARAVDDQGAMTSSAVHGIGASAFATVAIRADVPSGYPTVRLLDHTAGGNCTLQGPRTLVIYAHAADDSAVARVEFYAGGTKLGEDATGAVSGGETLYSCTWANAPAGTHVLTARAIDDTGFMTVSEAVTAVLEANTAPPAVTLQAPPAGLASGQPLTLSANASDGDGIDRVDFLLDGVGIGCATAAPWTLAYTAPRVGTYTLTARAIDGRGAAAISSSRVLTITGPTAFAAPGALSATATGSRRINLAWIAPTGAWTETRIERSVSGGTVWVRAATLPPGVNTWSDLCTMPGFTYRYRLRVADDQVLGTYSSEVTATTLPVESATPVAATGLTAAPVAGTACAIELAWHPPALANAQAVMARPVGAVSWLVVAWLPGDAATYRHRGLDAGSSWDYAILAYNGANLSRTSTPVAPAWSSTVRGNTGSAGVARQLTVIGGLGDGAFQAYALAQISAEPPTPEAIFSCWRSSTAGVDIVDPWNRHTAVFVPTGDVSVTAQWRNPGSAPPPTVSLSVSPSPVAEGTTATVSAVLSTPSAAIVNVTLSTSGSATMPGDATMPTMITIPAGATSASTILTTVQDTLDEDDETVVIAIATVEGATEAGVQQATVTIRDDDAMPTVSLACAEAAIAEAGGSTRVTANLDAVSGRTVTVAIACTGAAQRGTDYSLPLVLSIPAGSLSAGVTMAAINDVIDEPDEDAVLATATLTNAIGAATCTVLIRDDDAPPLPSVVLSASAAAIPESGGSAEITATLSAPSAAAVSVTLAATGTATLPTDAAVPATITIPAGALSAAATLTATQDVLDEDDETVVLAITAVVGATEAGVQQATVTIRDDDAMPTVSLACAEAAIAEAGGSTRLTASLDAVSGRPVTVGIACTGAALRGYDYALPLAITIPSGAISADVTLTAIDDTIDEPDEEAVLATTTLTNANGAAVCTVLIHDDDLATSASPRITVSPGSGGGGGGCGTGAIAMLIACLAMTLHIASSAARRRSTWETARKTTP
jgi:hypothetical protein